MDGSDLTAAVQIGEQLSVLKLLITSVQWLWVYDYFLTLGDEIKYAWSGTRSWIFALFIANRYTPVIHIVWIHITMFHYTKPATKWVAIFHTTFVTAFSQTAIALRIYAMTGKNRLIGGALALTIAAQLCHGIFSIVWVGLHGLAPFPEIDLDPFKVCITKQWQLGALLATNLTIFFDLLSFLIILITARRSRRNRYPGMPSILDAILRDSTKYFLFIFFIQLLSELFLFFVPAGVKPFPGMASTIFVPVMSSRLMLSLKKATVQLNKPWSLDTMATINLEIPAEGRVSYSAQQMHEGLHQTQPTLTAPNEEDIELDAVPPLPQDHDSHHAR